MTTDPSPGCRAIGDTPPGSVEFLQIDPTTRCNYSCAYCRGREMAQLDLEPALLRDTLDALPDLGYVELHGEGEPLLHPRFFELAGMVTARGIRASVYTNGSLLTAPNVERLLDAGLEKIVVSVDSPDPARFRAIRTGKLAPVLAGIRHLLRRRHERGLSAPAVGIAASIQRRFADDVPALIALCRALGLDGGLAYQPLNAALSYARRYPARLQREVMSLLELETRFREALPDPDDRRIVAGTSPHKGFFDVLFAPLARGERLCPWLERGMYVTARGFVTPCCMLHEPEALGRIGETPMSEIAKTRAAMRDALARGVVPGPCAGCEVAALVTGAPGNVMEAPDPGKEPPTAGRLTPADPDPGGDGRLRGPGAGPAPSDTELAALRAALASAHAEVQALRASWSWRISAPARRVYDLVLRWGRSRS